MVCLFCSTGFFFPVFLSEGWTCWWEHGEVYLGQTAGPHLSVWTVQVCGSAEQANFSSRVIVKFPLRLQARSIISAVRSCSPIWSFSKLLKTFRQTKVTADFSSNRIKLTTQGCFQLWAISSLHLSVFFFSLLVFLYLLNERIRIHDSLTYSFISMHASHVWAI